MSKIIHISIDGILSGWQSSCSYKDPDGDCIDECSVGRIAPWGGHYIAIIHDDVPEDERKELAEFIANAPEKIEKLEAKIIKLQYTLLKAADKMQRIGKIADIFVADTVSEFKEIAKEEND